MTPYDPTQTQQTQLAKVPPPQIPVAAGASPQVQPSPALARSIGGAMTPQGSAGAGIAQANPSNPLATAQSPAPTQGPEAKEAARLQASKPGAQQIHNPFLRTLATVGDALASTFAPRLATVLPGTTLHHNMLLNQAEHGAGMEQTAMDNASKRAQEGANVEHLGAETNELIPAQAENLKSEANARSNPQAKAITNEFEKWMHDNPNATLDDWEKFKADHEHAVKVATPFEKWMKDNPNATVQDWLKMNSENKPERTIPLEEQVINEHLQKVHPGESMALARQHTQPAPQRDPTVALDRETTRFAKTHEKNVTDATSQLEKIADARAMINGSAEAQALGIPKVLTALVSGQGSGVRITQPELNAIGNARGISGSVEGFINSLSGKGKLTSTQQKQLTDLLDGVQQRIQQKQQISADALDRINSAQSREEIIKADTEARRKLMAPQPASNGAAASGGYQVGHKYGGMTYQGGDPNKRESWK